MAKRKHTSEEIINKLREVVISSGSTVVEAVRRIGVSEQTLLPLAGRVRRPLHRPGAVSEAAGDGEQPAQAGGGRTHPGQPDTPRYSRRPLRETSEPRPSPPVCRIRQVGSGGIGAAGLQGAGTAPRSTHRHEPLVRGDEQALTSDIVGLATRFGRYGYRRITALLRRAGWNVNHKRVERIWRREGLKVSARLPRRGRLWLNDGSCVRLRPERRNHVWAYDFILIRTRDGRAVRLMTAT